MKSLLNRHSIPMILISLFFAVKALFLAFWVTPLWDIPDETGHFAYVHDIAEGRGVPLLGEAEIDDDIMRHLKQDANASSMANWIAQHPPIYHTIAALPLKIGNVFSNNADLIYRLPRIVSALSGALLLLVLFQTLRVVGLDTIRATAIAASVGFIPMVSHMSSGTNNDVSLFLFCAFATYFLACYLTQHNLRDAYWCSLWLAIAGGTKMTAWILLAPMVVIILVELPGPIKSWIKHATGISILALSVPIAWMARNIIYFGNPFYVAGHGARVKLAPLSHNFFDYLHVQPVLEHFILNFYGLIGWQGTGKGQVVWFQVNGLPRVIFSILIFCLACIFLFYILWLMYRTFVNGKPNQTGNSLLSIAGTLIENNHYSRILTASVFIVALFLAGYIGMTSYDVPSLWGKARLTAVSILIFIGILAIPLILVSPAPIDRIALYGAVLFIFFGSILLYQVYLSYALTGQIRATHGRYFYPVMPALLLSMSIAIMRMRLPALVVAVFTALLACMELETYLLQAIPFFHGGAL